MLKSKRGPAAADDNYNDKVVGVDGGEFSSMRIWERPRHRSGNFSRVFKPERPLSVEGSQRHLQEMLASKSDESKGGVTLTTDEARIHMPGDTSVAQIDILPSVLDGNAQIEIELKAQVHTYTMIQTGQAGAHAHTSKDVLFSEKCSLQQREDGRLVCMFKTSHFWVEQIERHSSLSWRAQATIPTGFFLHSSKLGKGQRRSFPAPSSFRDYNNRRMETCWVSYHWKVTRHVSGTFKRDERLWKSIIVVASPPDVSRNPILTAPLSYPPRPGFQHYLTTQTINKKIFGTAGMMAVEIAMPDIETGHPIFRPVPVVVRISVRAKTPSALLELGGDIDLPELPKDGASANGKGKGKFKETVGPHFIIERETFCRAFGSSFEYSIAQQPCHVRWNTGHVGNGFRQGRGSEGYENGREGATPCASEMASNGQAHGWTWPERDTETQTGMHSGIANTMEKGLALGSSSSAPKVKTFTADELQKFSYITSATLFGHIFLNIAPRIELPKLRVYYLLRFAMPVSGARNDVKADLTDVGVTLGIHPGERHLITEEDLNRAVLFTELFDPEGQFLSQSQPPPPPHPSSGHGSSSLYPVHSINTGDASAWSPSFLQSLRGDEIPYQGHTSNIAVDPAPSYEEVGGSSHGYDRKG